MSSEEEQKPALPDDIILRTLSICRPQYGPIHESLMQVSRLLPWTMKNYNLDEITTLAELRKNVALLFRQNSQVTDPKVTSLSIQVVIYLLQHCELLQDISPDVLKRDVDPGGGHPYL